MNHRVSMIPYGNMAPYRLLGPPRGCTFCEEFPRVSVGSLQSGSVAAACVPVGGLEELGDSVDFVGRFGIAARDQVRSVLLFSKVPMDDLGPNHALWVTNETMSSVRLFALLFGCRHGFDRLPCRARDRASASAVLLIGDEALVAYATDRQAAGATYPYTTDLASEWYAAYSLPFVFARWVVRAAASSGVRTAVSDWLATFRGRESELVATAIPQEAARLALPTGLIDVYQHGIRRVLAEEDMRGQDLFLRLCRERRDALAAVCRQWSQS